MFRNMKIGMRLMFGFGLVLAVLVVTGISGIWGVRTMSNNMMRLIQVESNIAEYSARARANVLGMRRYEKDSFLNVGAPEAQAKYFEEWTTEHKDLISRLDDLDKVADLKEDRDAVAIMRNELTAYEAGYRKVYGQVREGSIATPQAANAAISQYKESIHALEKAAKELAKSANDRMDAQGGVVEAFTLRLTLILAVLILAAILISIVVSLLVTRRITRPLKEGVDVADSISSGDLTGADLELDVNDELGFLATSLNKMKNALSNMIGSIAATSGSVASASEELSATVQQITRSVDEQASRASHVATSAAEMSQTVIDIARNAQNISNVAKDTVKVAEEGSSVVSKTIKEVQEIASTVTESSKMMASLGDRSRQIGEIITVINDIADQTNLLALNAAIEAARAGDQGRGFAVVADEVRKLAERTTRATTEIADMIRAIQNETALSVTAMKDSLERVALGVTLSTQAGDSLHRIVGSVSGFQSMVEQIASATEQMSTTSEQISEYIEVIANISKETSVGSRQILNASVELSKLSGDLSTMANRFRLAAQSTPAHQSVRLELVRPNT